MLVLGLLVARVLCCQLQLDKHHVITHAQGQGQRRAARQEVADLQAGNEGGEKGGFRNVPMQILSSNNFGKKTQ